MKHGEMHVRTGPREAPAKNNETSAACGTRERRASPYHGRLARADGAV